jgi:hypothetical protein
MKDRVPQISNFKNIKLVSNLLEIKGQGVLLLGSGKSTTSLYLTYHHDDVFLISDDYCYIRKINNSDLTVFKGAPTEYPKLGTFRSRLWDLAYSIGYAMGLRRTPETDYFDRGTHDMIKIYFGLESSNKLDWVRITSEAIDTITQRVAHKPWAPLDCVVFLIARTDVEPRIKPYLEVLQMSSRPEEREAYRYLSDVFYQDGAFKQNTHYVESSPSDHPVLFAILHLIDGRLTKAACNDFFNFFKETGISVILFFWYNNLIQKFQDLYNVIPSRKSSVMLPEHRILDSEEKYWRATRAGLTAFE